jgi:digeranylgeranylglycerophospholipid reductase
MKYDLIIIGAGPSGLMAARTAARDGLKVLVLEKKKEPTRIRRLCSQLIKVHPGGFSSDKTPTDIKIDRVLATFEVDYARHVIHLKNLGTTIDYNGELGTYYNETWVSPAGNTYNSLETSEHIYGFLIDKEALLTGLLDESLTAGCELRSGTKCTGIEDSPGGVTVKVSTATGEETLEAGRVIVADGAFSPLVTRLGFEKDRPRGAPPLKFLTYILDRVDTPFPDTRHIKIALPSLHKGFVIIGLWPHKRFQLGISTSIMAKINLNEVLERVMKDSPFSGWFARSKIVDKLGCNMPLVPPIIETARGNIICTGDNSAYAETAMKGALGCGIRAAQASKTALGGGDGNAEYNKYWQHAFNFHSLQYRSFGKKVLPIPRVCNDAETDTLYQWIHDNGFSGMPGDILEDNMEQFRKDLPEIADKVIVKGVPPGRPAASK